MRTTSTNSPTAWSGLAKQPDAPLPHRSHAQRVTGCSPELVVGASAMPLADVIDFEDGRFTLAGLVIRQMVDATITAEPRHTPGTAQAQAQGGQDQHAGHVRGLAKGLPGAVLEESRQIGRWVFAADRQDPRCTRSRRQHHQKAQEALSVNQPATGTQSGVPAPSSVKLLILATHLGTAQSRPARRLWPQCGCAGWTGTCPSAFPAW